MSGRIGLIGFVNTEEILADTIHLQTPDVVIDGYELFPNEAFGRAVDNRYKLYDDHEVADDSLSNMRNLEQLSRIGYSAINLGPDTAALMLEKRLAQVNVDYIGPRRSELDIELDKTKIFDIFPESSRVLPPTRILEHYRPDEVQQIINSFDGEVVVKFVGDYADHYEDSGYRRVRDISEFTAQDKLGDFISRSIESSGKAIVQKKIVGSEFSYTCLVDNNEGILSIGENMFYKRRYEGDQGPLCDGTGSMSITNSLPHVSEGDRKYIEDDIVRKYVNSLHERFGRGPKTFLNVDLIKDQSGNIYLLEINNRQPGGHTMSTLLPGLESSLADALEAAQENRLGELKPRFKKGVAVAVTVFPSVAPNDFAYKSDRPILVVPKNRAADAVRLYTGWVDLLAEDDDTATIQTNLTATLIAANHAPNIDQARTNVYSKLSALSLAGTGLTYRTDIGRL